MNAKGMLTKRWRPQAELTIKTDREVSILGYGHPAKNVERGVSPTADRRPE